jgi:glycosyltransferase involved in cell wall biosynthesis
MASVVELFDDGNHRGSPELATAQSLSALAGSRTKRAHQGLATIVAIPAYNEEVAIGSIVLRLKKYVDEVLVIDDGSKDRTAEVAKMANATVLSHATNLGKGASIRDAFAYARAARAGILVLIDGDGQHNPDEVPALIKPILDNEADIVNGSRFLTKRVHNIPLYRRMGQEILSFATNSGISQKITDSQNGFRAFSSRAFDCFSFGQTGMAIESEMLIDASDARMKIKEVPINVRYDVPNASSFNPISHGFGVLEKVLGLISYRRPLTFFFVPGLGLIFLGDACALALFLIYNSSHIISAGFGLGAISFILLGIVLTTTGLLLQVLPKMIKLNR